MASYDAASKRNICPAAPGDGLDVAVGQLQLVVAEGAHVQQLRPDQI
jgi:hypothetical protein